MKKLFIRLALLPTILLAAGCTGDDAATDADREEATFALSIQMPAGEAQTRIGLTQKSGSRDMAATWQADDVVQIIAVQGENQYNVGMIPVSDLSDDGKQAMLYFGFPVGMDRTQPFTLFSFAGIRGAVSLSEGEWRATCNAKLMRSPLDKFKAPMFARVETAYGQTPIVQFHHFGTYEVLHVSNNSGQSVSMTHRGFSIWQPWYQATALVNPGDGNADVYPMGDWQGEASSDVLSTPAGGEGVFVSWYIPSGHPISGARLLASVDGNTVSSEDTFTSSATLQRGRAYHMYATWDGEKLAFKSNAPPYSCPDDNHPHQIDLGLPSGTMWACCNVGATNPEEYGGYFAWGETEEKDYYDWSTYKFMPEGVDDWTQITKYQTDDGHTSACWYDNGTFIGDGKITLEPADDAATANWGAFWHMPTYDELKELTSKCSYEWTQINGIDGIIFKSSINGNSIFLPAAGSRFVESYYGRGEQVLYWSKSLQTNDFQGCIDAWNILFNKGYTIHVSHGNRVVGESVRPVAENPD